MRYVRVAGSDGSRLAVETGQAAYDLTGVEDPHDLTMSTTIRRDGRRVYHDSTHTGEMVRTCEELVSYLTRHNVVPETTVLLTGTALVRDDEFTLRPNDDVEITVEPIGSPHNTVVTV
ncbi:hypothetical protein BRC92_02645 [Halobacteriales archaeon QS_4_69_31]|nr:MAG: hypothetical protein BRC92_02645 [Halobacteriales archaeon QS_4_69_31]